MPVYELELDHQPDDQVFSYYYGDKLLHFNVSLLARMHKKMPKEFRRITMDLTDAEYHLCMEHRGIEEPKIKRLTGEQLRDPGYMVLLPNERVTIVDGHHRLVRRYRGGVRVMDFWITNETIWQHCLVEYPPEFEELLAQDIPPKVETSTDIASRVTLHGEKK